MFTLPVPGPLDELLLVDVVPLPVPVVPLLAVVPLPVPVVPLLAVVPVVPLLAVVPVVPLEPLVVEEVVVPASPSLVGDWLEKPHSMMADPAIVHATAAPLNTDRLARNKWDERYFFPGMLRPPKRDTRSLRT
jgi:hypothetical protein